MNPSMVCANSQSPRLPASPCRGWKSPGKAAPEAPAQQRTRNILSADGRRRPGGEAEPRRDSLGQIHPAGKPPGTPGDGDVPAGISPTARPDEGKVRKMSHQGNCLENPTFPLKSPSTAAAAGSDMEGKDRKKETGKSVTSESAKDTLGRLQPGTASPTRRKWNRDKIKGRSRSILHPGTPEIPSPAQHPGLGLGLD